MTDAPSSAEALDARKLLEQIIAPCDQEDNGHAWTKCKRCIAIHGVEERFGLSMKLLHVAVKQLALVDQAAALERQLLGAFDFAAHLQRQREFSERTFGPGTRTAGVVDHIRKELREIEAAPHDGSEWADVVILALDGFWRAGFSPEQIIAAVVAKQTKNEARTWPDWRQQPVDKAIEHVRPSGAALASATGETSR